MLFVFVLGLVIGLVVAWNIWPQPKWLQTAYDKSIKTLYEKKP